VLYGIVAATTALLLAAVLSALLRNAGLRLGVVDRRRPPRCRLPVLGGVAVTAATCLVVALGGRLAGQPPGPAVDGLLVAGAAVAALGLLADVRRVKPRLLVGGTALAAACSVPYEDTGVAGGVLAVVWITVVTLGFRALDHADGLAATVGVITAFGAAACAAIEVLDDLALLLSVLAAALTGFLLHNWPPARVGLGACGTLFAGFVLAASCVRVRAGYELGPTAAVLGSIAALAAADVLLVLLVRRRTRRPGPDHLAHRLRRLGLTRSAVVLLLGLASAGGVLVAVLVHLGELRPAAALWVGAGALLLVTVMLLVRPVAPPGARIQPPRTESPQVRAPLRVRNG
jgi:UDP-GlcNAc:undecaprenyl-phosphate GlcNAc-1-phosphate transferase